jgi:hypothetical protein
MFFGLDLLVERKETVALKKIQQKGSKNLVSVRETRRNRKKKLESTRPTK